MGISRALLMAGAVSVGAAGAVHAADLLPPAPPLEKPYVERDDSFSGWYLRGDVGIGLDRKVGASLAPHPLGQGGAGFVPTNYSLSDVAISGSPFIGFGVGYRFNSWFRSDLSLEYRTATFSAHDELAWNNGVAAPNTQFNVLRNFYRGNLTTMTAMFNGYIDLGTWHGITPFVGAGIGLANSRISGMTDNGYNNLYAGPGSFASSSTSGVFRDSRSTSFAWALMAGLGYQVNSRLTLEMGYRYLNVGKVKSSPVNCHAAGPGFQQCGGNALQMKRAGTHDMRIGMRWNLSEPAPKMHMEQPLIRKY